MKKTTFISFIILTVFFRLCYCEARAGEPAKTPAAEPVMALPPQKTEAPAMENIKQLPKPEIENGLSVEKSISTRRSLRRFAKQDLTLEQISQLLWAAQGITGETGKFRSAPSAGALYPLTIYVISSSGTYRYLPDGHKIEILNKRDQREELANACGGEKSIEEAALDIVIAADYGKTTWRYGNRGIRYVDMEAGHVAQNIHLQAVSLGLGSVPVGAFNDEMARKLIGLGAGQQPVYVIPIGYK